MTNALSKQIPKKTSPPMKVNKNPRHRAPIPLFPEVPKEDETKDSEIKLKLRRNPMVHNSPQYEKTYALFDGNTPEQYCHFQEVWD